MGKKSLISGADSYDGLVALVRGELRAGLEKVEAMARRQRAVSYWRIGRWIDRYTQSHPGSAPADIRRLAADIGFQPDLVIKMRKFYRCFPELPADETLSWSQYRALLSASDANRGRWLTRARRDGLGEGELYRLISDEKRKTRLPGVADKQVTEPGKVKLEVRRGRLYVYKTLQSSHWGLTEKEIMVDCGFEIRRKITLGSRQTLSGGHAVVSVKTEAGYRLKYASDKAEGQIYTYQARLNRVVDGDTLLLTVDAGFDIWLELRTRLRGIDAPELSGSRGQLARRFVTERLSALPFVVVKTWRPDKYGRYLADVFYRPGAPDPQTAADSGVFLNQELLDEGLAVPYAE